MRSTTKRKTDDLPSAKKFRTGKGKVGKGAAYRGRKAKNPARNS
jgi:hypothetical protein